MLELKEITKSFEKKPLLTGVSFSIADQEIVALLGSSGSGKSTILRIIAGLENAETGQVLWNGKEISLVPPWERGFGLMFQDYALFPHRNVAQNLAFGLRMQGLSKPEIDQRVAEALASIKMADFAKRSVLDLSGGEQQRVALARALAPRPKLLLLDEPLGALDHTLRVSLLQELRETLHTQKIPAIYVTHDREEAFAIADRLILLHSGKIVQSGHPLELYQAPSSAWVAEFLDLGNLVHTKRLPDLPNTAKTGFGDIRLLPDCASPQASSILIRPQAITIVEKAQCTVNEFPATVSDIKFTGLFNELMLKMSDGSQLKALSLQSFPIGAQVWAQFLPDDLQCLPEV